MNEDQCFIAISGTRLDLFLEWLPFDGWTDPNWFHGLR